MAATRTALAAASFFALAAAAMRAAWLARIAASRSAILADSSASAISSCSRADGFFDAASFKEAFDGRIDGLADAGGSFALAVPKARQQAVRAISLRIVIRKVKNINRINGCPTAKL